MSLEIKRLTESAVLPTRGHADDAGLDLYTDRVVYVQNEATEVHTGIAVSIPKGFVGIIKEKSGLALKRGIRIHGGVIDSGYRGEVIVLASRSVHLRYPLGYAAIVSDTIIEPGCEYFGVGEKIAQLIIVALPFWFSGDPTEVEEFSVAETARGTDGFGSTGR